MGKRGLVCLVTVVAVLAAGAVAWAASGWRRGKVPGSVVELAGVSCANASQCWAGVDDDSKSFVEVVLHSTNGGKTWSSQTVFRSTAPSPGGPNGVACPTAKECIAIAGSVFRTADGGKSWKLESQPSGLNSTDAITCANASDCWLAGDVGASEGMFGSTDGGKSWTAQASWSEGSVSQISCLSKSDCWAAGERAGTQMYQGFAAAHKTTNGGRTWSPVDLSGIKLPNGSPPIHGLSGVSCTSAKDCILVGSTTGPPEPAKHSGVILVTTNGGSSWSFQRPPSPVDVMGDVWCARGTKRCWATGESVLATGITSSGYVLTTSDGGTTWSVQTHLGGDQGDLTCVNTKDCVVVSDAKAWYTTSGG
jgi:photosystem II stability/assembly factor-like uncharacterized protein